MLFDNIENEVSKISGRNVKKFVIGKSVCGRDIWCVRVGRGGKKLIVQYAIHAREFVTTLLAIEQMRDANIWNVDNSIYFVPLVNPDGVALCMEGVESIQNVQMRQELLQVNGGGNFGTWKANARCVDLNVNFDARWGCGKCNITYKAGANYIGECPESEPEVCALVNLTKYVLPDATLSYHSKGEEIYYEFGQNKADYRRDKVIARQLAKLTGYTLRKAGGSVGGYKDWCIEKLGIPSFTIEVGSEKYAHPIQKDKLPKIWQQNQLVLKKLLALL